MRIWDLPPSKLCKNHLLGEHRELHAIWTVITTKKTGYSMHPETIRWKGRLAALYIRHESLVSEMQKRGYSHHTPLEKKFAKGKAIQTKFVNTKNEQIDILRKKNCQCKI